MTKIYPIIYLNGFLYAIEKRKPIKGERHISIHGHVDYIFSTGNNCDFDIIISSSDPSLTDVPKLPEMEENINRKTNKYVIDKLSENSSKYDNYSLITGYKDGYKAASKKKYTEEDIMTFYKYVKTHTFQEAIDHLNKSINPIPKEVELEVEDSKEVEKHEFDGSEQGEITWVQRLKVENGFVIVKSWRYE